MEVKKDRENVNSAEYTDNPRLRIVEACRTELKQLQEDYAGMEHRYNRISLARLAAFLIVTAGIVLLFFRLWWAVILAACGTILFVWLVILHSRLEREQQLQANRMEVLGEWIAKGINDWEHMSEDGSRYLAEDNYVAKDLDLLGPHSLYQMICTAHTEAGKDCLADVILRAERAEIPEDAIRKRQEAIRELTSHRDFRLRYETLSMEQDVLQKDKRQVQTRLSPEQDVLQKDTRQVQEYSDSDGTGQTAPISDPDDDQAVSKGVVALAFLVPILLVISMIGAGISLWQPYWILVVYFAGLFVSFILSGYCSQYMEPVFGRQRQLRSSLSLMELVVAEKFESSLLTELKTKLQNGSEHSAMQGMKRLERLMSIYHLRHNPIVHFLLSGICLYDIHLACAAVRWRRTYEHRIRNVMQALAEMEMLNSFALFAEYQECSYPVIRYDSALPELIMKNGYHPFLICDRPVKNSIHLHASPRVITGSNMSGKTTFLRTIGMNVILAYAGAPVCAEEMELSRMRLYTSMRVMDDVNHGISTFYAEILRIKEMVEYGEQNAPMLCLIDEIFKGTNSADRIVGAEAVIRKLTKPSILSVISTHDFELCELAENYHFEEFYDEEGIHFDYLLKEGRCRTTNALYLLKLAGLN